jgi:hypothetical protein
MQSYQGFGFTFTSDWSLPLTLITPIEQVDVIIEEGNCPDAIDCSEEFGRHLQANQNEILLKVSDIATFYCTKNHISVCSHSTDVRDVQCFLIYAAIPYWLLLQGCLVLRGCALSFNDQVATLILSHTGGGSSTLGYLATKKSAVLISDHLCVLKQHSPTEIRVYPGYKEIKLWRETRHNLTLPQEKFRQLRATIKSYSCKTQYVNSSLPVKQVLFLAQSNQIKATETIRGAKKLSIHENYTYYLSNNKVVCECRYLSLLWLLLAKQTNMYRLHRYREMPKETLAKVVEALALEKEECI